MKQVVLGDFDYAVGVIEIEKIDIGKRFRTEFPGIAELASSIKQIGVTNSIAVLDKQAAGTDYIGREGLDDTLPYLLVSGERRVKASLMAGKTKIPARIFNHAVNEYQYRLSELHENIFREDFTPIEKQAALAETHRLLVEIHGRQHTQKETAAFANVDPAAISRAAKVKKALIQFPELKEKAEEAKTDRELYSLIKEHVKQKAKEEKVKRLKKKGAAPAPASSPQSTPPGKGTTPAAPSQPNPMLLQERRTRLIASYHVGDFFDLIKKVPERSVDFIELDPDWGIDFIEREAEKGQEIDSSYREVKPEDYKAYIEGVANEAYRVMKDHSWAIVWYSMEHWHEVTKQALIDAGFFVTGMPAFWDKAEMHGGTSTPAYRLADNAAAFFYIRKGNCRISKERMGRSNVFSYRRPRKNERFHAAEKPIELYMDIIRTFSNEGARLISGFAGSGNFLLAANNLKRNAIGFDLVEQNKNNFILKVHEQEPGSYKTYRD